MHPPRHLPGRRAGSRFRRLGRTGALLLVAATPLPAATTRFYFGNDLSCVNQMEDCGAVYREDGVPKDPFGIFADHGTNLVRVRLWHDPWWQPLIPQTAPDAKPQYNDLADVIETITRAKARGMHVMLDLHFSDFWADPGRQVIPRAWSAIAHDDPQLEAAVHDYVRDVLTQLDALGLMPEIVKLGNETNPGLLISQTLTASWNATTQQLDYTVGGIQRTDNAHFARMWNAGIRAVREVGATAGVHPRIALHVSGLAQLVGFYDWMQQIGVTDFDIMGLSYYYAWHGGSIGAMGAAIRQLKTKYPQYDVMVVETGYLWDQANIDGLGNIINTPDPAYLPVHPANQRRYLVDYTQEVMNAGGTGVVFWEPAWVSTPCRTPWGVGSSHEHVAYFDHRDGNNFHVGGTWMEATYTGLAARPEIAVQPVAMTARTGADAFFSVTATGDDLTYQWRKDGVAIPGATGSSLFLGDVGAADAGTYSVLVTNGVGVTASAAAPLALVATGSARLVNLSARAQVGSDANILIPGFVIGGTGAKSLLIRAVGPKLADYQVTGVLPDPALSVVPLGTSTVLAANDNWVDFADPVAMEAVLQAVGAFPFGTSTRDAALLLTVPPGAYTAPTLGVGGGTGVALVELYDADPIGATAGLLNISARAQVGAGADVLIPGFVVHGDVAMTLLIRAVGPQLADYQLTGLLADPAMTVFRSLSDGGSEEIAGNDNWSTNAQAAELVAASDAVHAFPLDAGSADAAVLLALGPGAYTVAIRGADGGSGLALMEVYRVAP